MRDWLRNEIAETVLELQLHGPNLKRKATDIGESIAERARQGQECRPSGSYPSGAQREGATEGGRGAAQERPSRTGHSRRFTKCGDTPERRGLTGRSSAPSGK